ncbi:MAG: S8 family serine peptidase [Demequina sp.]|nr:S8 family serine peptidase [Demequina sp.]
MADHLRLPEPSRLDTRRKHPGPPGGTEVDRVERAKALAGVLAGLGLPYPGATTPPTVDGEEEALEDSRLVLVFADTGMLEAGPFRRWNMTPVAEGVDSTYMVISDAESRRVFARLVEEYGGNADDWANPKSWQKQLDAITGVRLYDRDDRADSRLNDLEFRGTEIVDILIWPSTLNVRKHREDSALARLNEIRELVAEFTAQDAAVHTLAADPRPDSTMARVAVTRPLLDVLLDHVLVERVRPPLRPEVTAGNLLQAGTTAVAPIPSGLPVGVIDDLVTDNILLHGIVQARTGVPDTHTFGVPTAHGTHVAGVAAYGDLRAFVTHGTLPTPRPIYSARIMERDPTSPGRAVVAGLFHEQLEGAIRWLHGEGVKVITCSINDDAPDSTPTPGESMAIIDALVRELDVVVVLSAGNVHAVDPHHWLNDYPKYLDRAEARIADPAGAALALTVGSRAAYNVPALPASGTSPHVAIAPAGGPSPFTRTGPGRGRGGGSMKPEFIAHGGNVSWDKFIGKVPQPDPNMSVVTTAPAGSPGGRVLTVDDGTSMATPYVANQVATIATRYPTASANLLRALTALAGEDGGIQVQGSAIISAYGEPVAAHVLESGTHQVIVTYEGTIACNTSVVHRLPVPEAFATGKFDQRLEVALAFDPPCAPLSPRLPYG